MQGHSARFLRHESSPLLTSIWPRLPESPPSEAPFPPSCGAATSVPSPLASPPTTFDSPCTVHHTSARMLLPKGGVTWKSAKARLPPWKAIIMFLTRTRFLVAVALTGLIILLWRGISVSTQQMSKYAITTMAYYIVERLLTGNV